MVIFTGSVEDRHEQQLLAELEEVPRHHPDYEPNWATPWSKWHFEYTGGER